MPRLPLDVFIKCKMYIISCLLLALKIHYEYLSSCGRVEGENEVHLLFMRSFFMKLRANSKNTRLLFEYTLWGVLVFFIC